jgi:hypothetical protein
MNRKPLRPLLLALPSGTVFTLRELAEGHDTPLRAWCPVAGLALRLREIVPVGTKKLPKYRRV